MEKTKRNQGQTVFIVAIIVIFLALFILAARVLTAHFQVGDTYEEAVELLKDGDYTAARELFESIREEGYGQTASMIHLCKSLEYNEEGWYDIADDQMDLVSLHSLSQQEEEALKAYRESLMVKRRKIDAQYILEEAKRQEEAQAAETAPYDGIPYVGMSEKRIGKTLLGEPSEDVRHNYESINGQQYRANLYDFYEDGRLIFTARCIQGEVTEVFDHRDQEPYVPTKTPTPSDKDEADPYDAASYSNEEDFYEDHYYEFFDYYDAENYWREHQ